MTTERRFPSSLLPASLSRPAVARRDSSESARSVRSIRGRTTTPVAVSAEPESGELQPAQPPSTDGTTNTNTGSLSRLRAFSNPAGFGLFSVPVSLPPQRPDDNSDSDDDSPLHEQVPGFGFSKLMALRSPGIDHVEEVERRASTLQSPGAAGANSTLGRSHPSNSHPSLTRKPSSTRSSTSTARPTTSTTTNATMIDPTSSTTTSTRPSHVRRPSSNLGTAEPINASDPAPPVPQIPTSYQQPPQSTTSPYPPQPLSQPSFLAPPQTPTTPTLHPNTSTTTLSRGSITYYPLPDTSHHTPLFSLPRKASSASQHPPTTRPPSDLAVVIEKPDHELFTISPPMLFFISGFLFPPFVWSVGAALYVRSRERRKRVWGVACLVMAVFSGVLFLVVVCWGASDGWRFGGAQ
ncbi:hypothetical protein HDV00_001706 [Rhizophlyctis rosea]|nr:hypothetical protein HDV00_001706 [Rhizophlyctis rosea]